MADSTVSDNRSHKSINLSTDGGLETAVEQFSSAAEVVPPHLCPLAGRLAGGCCRASSVCCPSPAAATLSLFGAAVSAADWSTIVEGHFWTRTGSPSGDRLTSGLHMQVKAMRLQYSDI